MSRFSINAPVRSTDDHRNHLFKDYLRFVSAFMPKVVLIENVPGLVSFEHGATLHAIMEALANLGYGADVRILGAAYYGVPQMRWRTIILGFRGAENVTHTGEPSYTMTRTGHLLFEKPRVYSHSPTIIYLTEH